MDVDVAASNFPVNIESVSANSMVEENGNGGEPIAPPAKKQRFGEEMNRVAEIVLVLSALGRMRGGKTPTELEVELMVEARSKLVEMCQEFTPKDIIGSNDVRAVTEDLGLNCKTQDQSLGFRAPKLTISEKLSLGKRKMEEATQFLKPTVSTGYASHLSQPNGGVASPGPGTASHSARISTNHRPLSSGIVNVSSPFVSAAKNVSVSNKWISSGVTTVNPAGSHFRMERPQMMLNGASQGTANSSANYYAASWSAQPQSTISFSTAPDKKVPIQSSARVKDQSFRPFMSQTPHRTFPGTNQQMQGMHYGQTSSFGNNHSEIAKAIHKVLHPRVKEYPLWNLPSRDYVSRAMACQICKSTINEVETLLICDACEKAYHLKCLPANNLKGLQKSEWHCSRCVQASNGKPFPPIYGRTIPKTTAKMPSSAAGIQLSTAKKVGSTDIMVNQQKPIVTTSPGVQNFPGFVSGAATTSHSETSSVNANTTAGAAKKINIGPQGFRESLICSTIPSASVSFTGAAKTTNIGPQGLTESLNRGTISPARVSLTSAAKTTNIGPQGLTESLNCGTISPARVSLTSAAKTTNIGPQGFRERLICSTKSPASLSLTETPNPTVTLSTSVVTSNGLISKPLTPVGTMSSTFPLPVGNQVPVNATSSATLSTPMTASLVGQAPTVTENGDSSSIASGTAHHSILNTNLTTQVHALTVASTGNSQPAVSHSETAKATEDAAIGQALDADDGPQVPMENFAWCENPSEPTPRSDSLTDKISENGQESSKDATEKFTSGTCQNHPTESPAAVISDQDSKITAKTSIIQLTRQEKTAPRLPLVSCNYLSQTDKETPNVQDSLQNVPGDSQEGKGSNVLDIRHQEQPSDPEFGESDSIKEANAA